MPPYIKASLNNASPKQGHELIIIKGTEYLPKILLYENIYFFPSIFDIPK